MTVRSVKKLIRRSSANGDSSALSAGLPLAKGSIVMKSLINNVLRSAKDGFFAVISGHHGDLVEAPSLFIHVSQILGIEDYAEVKPGDGEYRLLREEANGVEGLFFARADLMSEQAQKYIMDFMADHLRLVMLCIPDEGAIDIATLFIPAFLQRCEATICSWPRLKTRDGDKLPLVIAAKEILEKQFTCKIVIDPDAEKYLIQRQWQSTSHMMNAMLRALKHSGAGSGSKVVLHEDAFTISRPQPSIVKLPQD